jgi:DNA-binding MarR family transcriptional regulator
VADEYDVLERALAQLLRLNSSRKVHARFSAAAGVSLSQPAAVLLRRIAELGPLSLGQAAELVHMDPAAAGRQVKLLEREGLVVRSTHARDDARVIVVRATPKGTAVVRRLVRVWHQHMEDALSAWSRGDRAALARLLSRFVDDMRAARYREPNADEAAG